MSDLNNPRYTLYQYGPHHYAIDCRPCNRKITNLTPSNTSGEIIDKLAEHDERCHQ